MKVYISLKNKRNNLCDSCKNCFADCKAEDLIFGKGNDNNNVVLCDTYESAEYVDGIQIVRIED